MMTNIYFILYFVFLYFLEYLIFLSDNLNILTENLI
jgi:hypothetical protein